MSSREKVSGVEAMAADNITSQGGMSQMATRATMSSVAGSALEWLDFAAYGAIAATVLPQLFFNNLESDLASILSLATLTIGFIARPAGGVICGYFGDRFGRKKLLIFTFLLMGISSFAIGSLPTYASIGIYAPIALVFLRFLQGFALGGEVTGSQLLTMEHAPINRRGFFSSFIAMGSPLAQVLANAMLFVITAVLTSEQFIQFGWRIPFLLSFLRVALGIYIRLRVAETPLFREAQKKQKLSKESPSMIMTKLSFRTVFRLFLVWAAVSVGYFIASVFALSYITRTMGVSKETAFGILIIAHFVSMITMGYGGLACDRIGRRATMLRASLLMLLAMCIFFPLINTDNIFLMGAGIIFLLGAAQMHAGVQPSYFAEIFPTEVRYIGSALSYNLANLVGSTAPFVAAYVQTKTDGASWPIVCIGILFCLASMTAIYIGPETLKIENTHK
jgi:MFS family permease